MSVPQIYTKEYYERIRAVEDRHWWHAGMREIAAALLSSAPDTIRRPRVLDAGCGTGAAMAWARSATQADGVTGIDVSAYALAFCRHRGERLLAQSSIMALPFRDSVFDLVLCNDVLQHLPVDGGVMTALGELHRVLRPGGLALVRTNSRLGLRAAAAPDFQRFDVPRLTATIRSAGFHVTRASYANLLLSLHASFTGRLRGPVRRGGDHGHGHRGHPGLPREAVMNRRWLNRLLTWILIGEARYLGRVGRSLPFGHTIVCLAVKPG